MRATIKTIGADCDLDNGVLLSAKKVEKRLTVPEGYTIWDFETVRNLVSIIAVKKIEVTTWRKRGKKDSMTTTLPLNEFYKLFPELKDMKEGFFAKMYYKNGNTYVGTHPFQRTKPNEGDVWFFTATKLEKTTFFAQAKTYDVQSQNIIVPKQKIDKIVRSVDEQFLQSIFEHNHLSEEWLLKQGAYKHILYTEIYFEENEWVINGFGFKDELIIGEPISVPSSFFFRAAIEGLPKEGVYIGTTTIDGEEVCIFDKQNQVTISRFQLGDPILNIMKRDSEKSYSVEELQSLFSETTAYKELIKNLILWLVRSGDVFEHKEGEYRLI